ncbi:MAG: hypothetical protein ACP5VC_17940 [Bryobacteraceae bacterium]
MDEEVRQTEYDFPFGIPGLLRPGKAVIVEKPIYEPFAVLTSPQSPRPLAGLIPLWWLDAGPPIELDRLQRSVLAAEDWHLLRFYAMLRLQVGRMPTLNLLRPLVVNPVTSKGLCIAHPGPAELQHLPITAVTGRYRTKLRSQAAG